MAAVNQEQLKDTEAKISCTVSGLTKALDEVKWTKSDDTPITSGEDDFVIDKGTLSGNSQTTILTIPAAANTADATYNCLITSDEHGKDGESTSVRSNVFSKSDSFLVKSINVHILTIFFHPSCFLLRQNSKVDGLKWADLVVVRLGG